MIIAIPLIFSIAALAGDGSGDIRVGYVYLDEEGNESINQPTFNEYDGIGVSLEKFRYVFTNGMRINTNLQNINLENRNLSFEFSKPGLFGIETNSNQFRRVYDFEGNNYTKRNLTSANVWVNVLKYAKIYAKSSFNDLSGEMDDLFGSSYTTIPHHVDYARSKNTCGTVINYEGRSVRVEYGASDFDDKTSDNNDQSRISALVSAVAPVPRFEWLVLSGAYSYFETEYEYTEFKIKSTTAKGGALAELPYNLSLNYFVIFNRAGSDSDFVETDNLAHAAYLSYKNPGRYGATIGYQNDTRDDYEDAIKANSYYLSAWFMPNRNFEFKGDYGYRSEDIDEGARLVGEECRDNIKVSAKYKYPDKGWLKAGFISRSRENDDLGSKVNYDNIYADALVNIVKYADLSIGYAYSVGKYENNEQTYEFDSHQLHGDIQTKEYKNLTAQFGVVYYRSQKDLDVESFTIRSKLVYNFVPDGRVEIAYNVYNFDDLDYLDRYFTENFVEINIIKTLNF